LEFVKDLTVFCDQIATILGTTNHGNPMRFVMKNADGSEYEVDRTDDIIQHLRAMEIDALICIGGDGTLTIAHALHQRGLAQGLRVIGVPKTIDNDLDKTYTTFGFDTAVAFATECIDRLHSTAESHRRIMVVEVMGRYAGWIALHAGMASTAHAILIPEIPYDIHQVAQKIHARTKAGRHYSIVVVAEGAQAKDGQRVLEEQARMGGVERLGGVGEQLAHQLEAITGKEARAVVLGHLLRGGSPTSFDRLSAMRFGAAAVRALDEGHSGIMVALAFPNVEYVNLAEVAGRMKAVPLDGDTIQTGRDIGICFGD
jgi:6-phosphofructokinase